MAPAEGVGDLIEELEQAAQRPAKQRTTKITSLVDSVCSKAYDRGLSSSSLSRLVGLVTLPSALDQASIGKLVRSLYPETKVPDATVIKVVCSLGHGREKPSYSTQAALLKWLVMIHDVLETPKILSQMYSVFFNLVDTVAIRSQICHVLSLITRRRHVRPFRIQELMELTRQAGNEPALVGLMRVYKDYYPDVIVGTVTSGRAAVFTHPNPEWRQRLGEIQDTHFQRTQEGLRSEERTFRVSRKTKSANGKRSSIIPEVYTSRAQETSITLEEIEDVHDFVQKLEKIEPPNQLVAVIGDPLLQKFLQLKDFENSGKRIDNWLYSFFEDQLERQSSGNQILEMLQAVLEYTRYTKVVPKACSDYLNSMIPEWNGSTGRHVILRLMAFTPLKPFDEIYQFTFEPLEQAVLDDGTIESKTALLSFYTLLLDQWTIFLLAEPSPTVQAAEPISALITHVNSLALTIVQSSLSIHTISTILTFYERIAALITNPALTTCIRIVLPPAELIYSLAFTTSLATLSRLCAILALYKKAFEVAMAPKATPGLVYPGPYVNRFNGFLMDLCNCLWRSRAFNTSDPNAMGCLLPSSVTSSLARYASSLESAHALSALFALSLSPTVCLLAIEYVRELEDAAAEEIVKRHAGPVFDKTLKQLDRDGGLSLQYADYRLGVLRHMENKGVHGVGELMYNTMKNLMPAKG